MKGIKRYLFPHLGFSLRGRGKDILYGMLAAMALYGVGFALSLTLGVVSITDVHFDIGWLASFFFFFLLVSVTEEMVIRGVVLGWLLYLRMNKFLALCISSLIFFAMHLTNPNVAFLPLLNLFLAGLLLGSAYVYTRNLWFPISLHLFWNWLQGPVLGYGVSGNVSNESLLKLQLSDDTLLTGGAFGFEGSLICTVLTVMLTVCIIWRFERTSFTRSAPHLS